MEPIALLDVLRRHAAMIVAVCIVAGVAGYAFSFLLPMQYEASALLLVRPQSPIKIDTAKPDKEFLDFPMGTSSSIETPGKTYIEIIKSPTLIGKVVAKLGLDKTQDAKGTDTSESSSVGDLFSILVYGSRMKDDPFANTVKQVQKGLTLKTREETFLFEINYVAKDPQLAATVANTTAQLFIDFLEEIRRSETQHIRDQLHAQLQQTRQQLDAARDRLENYKKAHSVFLYEAEYAAKLKVVSDLQAEIVKADVALVGSHGTPSTVGVAEKRARLIRSVGERQAELLQAPEIEHDLKQLESDVKVASTAYEIVDKEYKQADIRYSYATPEVRLVSQPVVAHLPSSPIRIKIAGLAVLGALVVGVGIAFLLEYLNHRVRSIRDLEDFVGLKVLGTIPRVSRARWRHAGLL